MMKIGILTFYRVANYGAMLQAFALWQFLASYGHDVKFIRIPKTSPERIPLWRCFVARSIHGVRMKLKQYVRHSVTDFAAAYPQTRMCHTLKQLRSISNSFDAIIVGSDQMWNPLWCSGRSLPYVMLEFAPEHARRISYAVSFSTTEWKLAQNAKLAGELLKKFSSISVREESGAKLVEQLSGRTDARCVLDPTLLKSADFYRSIFDTPGNGIQNAQSYIFCYLLDEWSDPCSETRALEVVKSALSVDSVITDQVNVTGRLHLLSTRFSIRTKVSVPEWVRRIELSEFVFTNSFHGTVFAILFHKPFVSLLLRGRVSGMNERLISLTNRLGLTSRVVYADNIESVKFAVDNRIDWADVDARVKHLREESTDWLNRALS